MPKDPSFDSYLDQQIEEHMAPEHECLECKELQEKIDQLEDRVTELEVEVDSQESAASHDYPSLRKFNPLAIILEEEDV
tara:strand:- start:29 stop:265 length:237 start_codon:yes stop_codon:yes gene_type:complete